MVSADDLIDAVIAVIGRAARLARQKIM